MKHLRCYVTEDDTECMYLECTLCKAEFAVDVCEPNSFKDVYEWMSSFRQDHSSCTEAKPKKKAKPKVTTEPDPMASAQAAVLRERLETFNKS